MKTNYIPKTEDTRTILRMAATIGLATSALLWLPACTSLQEPYYGQNNYPDAPQGYNSNQGSRALQSLISSAQGATVTRNGTPNFDSSRFLNNLTRNLNNQVLGSSNRYNQGNRYTRYNNNGYNQNSRYNQYNGNNNYNNYRGQNSGVYKPNPSHRQAYLERRAAQRQRQQSYQNSQYYGQYGSSRNNYSNNYGEEPLYKRLPNGQFVPIR